MVLPILIIPSAPNVATQFPSNHFAVPVCAASFPFVPALAGLMRGSYGNLWE